MDGSVRTIPISIQGLFLANHLGITYEWLKNHVGCQGLIKDKSLAIALSLQSLHFHYSALSKTATV